MSTEEVGVDKGLEITPLYLSPKIDSEKLEQRIYTRVDKILKEGLIDENKALVEKGYTYDLPAMSGIGYREFDGYFNKEKSIEEVADEIKLRTRQYAKRQVTWFKKNQEINNADHYIAKTLINNFLKEKQKD